MTATDLLAPLQAAHARLVPMQIEHGPALVRAAADGELWTLPFTVVPGAHNIAAYLDKALAGRDAGHVMPFVVIDQRTDQVLGSTRFWKIDRDNRKLEIGHTWLATSAQGTGINTAMKFAMLEHAFETMGCVRVQFTTDELNTRSRAAILALGAVQEGIVRHERIMPDGRKRNSVRFSIIDSEWPAVKAHLLARLARR